MIGLVGNDVVDEVGAARSREAEIVDLDGRRPEGEDLGPAMLAESREVDRDVDLHPAHALSDIEVALVAHIDEVVEGGRHALADLAVALQGRTRGRWSRSAALVVMLEHARDEECHRVRTEVGGKIGDANLVVRVALALP